MFEQGWFMIEMSGLFIVLGIVVGVVADLTLTKVVEGFTAGFHEVLVCAVIAGVARADVLGLTRQLSTCPSSWAGWSWPSHSSPMRS